MQLKDADPFHQIGLGGGSGGQWVDRMQNNERRLDQGLSPDKRVADHVKEIYKKGGEDAEEKAAAASVVVVRLPPNTAFDDGNSEKEFKCAAEANEACMKVLKSGDLRLNSVLYTGKNSAQGVQIRYKVNLANDPFTDEISKSGGIGLWQWQKNGDKYILINTFKSKDAARASLGMTNQTGKKSLAKAIDSKNAWEGFFWTSCANPPC